MKQEDDFLDRKNDRRKKIKTSKFDKKNLSEDGDDKILNKKIKNQIRKQKEDFETEEWEDWDRYYNH